MRVSFFFFLLSGKITFESLGLGSVGVWITNRKKKKEIWEWDWDWVKRRMGQ